MVFFTCNNCGESLKKNKVEKHFYTQCRNPVAVSCIDCLKDFRGNEFQAHTKCITEDEKYSAKGFVPKPSFNKGERKQQEWLDVIQSVKEDKSQLNKAEIDLLETLSQHENVPRKKKQFQNFLQNIPHGRTGSKTVDHVWQLLDEKQKSVKNTKDIKEDSENKNKNSEEENGDLSSSVNIESTTEIKEEEKLSKKERKEKRKREKYVAELHEIENKQNDDLVPEEPEVQSKKKKSKHVEIEEQDTGVEKKKKKSKKAKENGIINGDDSVQINGKNKSTKSKKRPFEETKKNETTSPVVTKKKKKNKELDQESANDDSHISSEEVAKPVKFNWEVTILKVLESKGELPLKRLRKKVISEYQNSEGCIDTSMEKTISRFNKKLLKVRGLEVTKEVARLVSLDFECE